MASRIDAILEHDECDVDLQTRIDGETPLHLAMRVADGELRTYLGACRSPLGLACAFAHAMRPAKEG
jgi:hypothetical protein